MGDRKTITIGVLALQGAFREHIESILRLSPDYPEYTINAVEVRRASQLDQIDGLIIPGGESTAMSVISNMSQMHKNFYKDQDLNVLQGISSSYLKSKKPVWGTCAGAILLSRDIENMNREYMSEGKKLLGQMNMTISRNYFGSQAQSFEKDIEVHIDGADKSYPGVFIRAPAIMNTDSDVQVLATLQFKDKNVIVAAQQEHMLATVFHPELTEDLTFHKHFIDMIVK
ncbi:pyridoxal 5'-phosphate synthase pdxT subunit [Acrasis kona]|uniref:glutaminase n=1 Tax=Acrasis kona TaxID=1008807 RepID=A0AAW2YQ45_9EUKA